MSKSTQPTTVELWSNIKGFSPCVDCGETTILQWRITQQTDKVSRHGLPVTDVMFKFYCAEHGSELSRKAAK